jgi:hypothetical protein
MPDMKKKRKIEELVNISSGLARVFSPKIFCIKESPLHQRNLFVGWPTNYTHQSHPKLGLLSQGRPSESNQRILIDIGRKLKSVEEQLSSQDSYVRERVATQMSIRELIEALQKQLQVIPSVKSVDLNEMKNITENHKKVLAFLAHDPSTAYTYQELAKGQLLTDYESR